MGEKPTPEELMQEHKLIFTVEGWNPGSDKPVKYGLAFKMADDPKDWTPEIFLMHYRAAMRSLYRYQKEKLGVTRGPDGQDIYEIEEVEVEEE